MKRLAVTLLVMALAIVALACEAELDRSLVNVEVGDCVAPGESGVIEKLEPKTCVPGHGLLRVTRKFELLEYSSWPGQAQVEAAANMLCPNLTAATLMPTKRSWEHAGDREVVCFEYVR